ncbi:YheU family protein [Marinomonas sp. 15G1-11]|uniref:YheU family protein n=1 Tax=Marinomonas phaeophyticola TaxID=3004091 RepID=A0ABT4JZ20_9GAMM|nr:YheU family protein [Marinomonas sp. 15G1-11]MCZ2723332.1 YheU family protein [Marinomonas sp. 15G1-11]
MDTLIPHDSLQKETLITILEEIVTRDGTDYGNYELTLEDKVAEALVLLSSKSAFLLFDTESETVKLLSKDQLQQYDL